MRLLSAAIFFCTISVGAVGRAGEGDFVGRSCRYFTNEVNSHLPGAQVCHDKRMYLCRTAGVWKDLGECSRYIDHQKMASEVVEGPNADEPVRTKASSPRPSASSRPSETVPQGATGATGKSFRPTGHQHCATDERRITSKIQSIQRKMQTGETVSMCGVAHDIRDLILTTGDFHVRCPSADPGGHMALYFEELRVWANNFGTAICSEPFPKIPKIIHAR